MQCSHCDCVAAEGVEDVGGAGEVEHELGRAGVRDALYLHASVGADGDGQSLVDSRRPIGPSVPVRALGWRSPRWMEVRSGAHLAVDERGDGEVPRGVGGHAEPQEGPDPVVVEGGDEHRGGAAGAEDVRPCPLVQPVVDVVDVAARANAMPRVRSVRHGLHIDTALFASGVKNQRDGAMEVGGGGT